MKKYVLLVALLMMVAIPMAVAAAKDTTVEVNGQIPAIPLSISCTDLANAAWAPAFAIPSDSYATTQCAITTGKVPWTLSVADLTADHTGHLTAGAGVNEKVLQYALQLKDINLGTYGSLETGAQFAYSAGTGTGSLNADLSFFQYIRSGDEQGSYSKTLTVTLTA